MRQSGSVDYTTDEMMTVAASHELDYRVVCFVGIGLPSEAANLARDARAELLPDLRVRHSGRQTRRPSPQHRRRGPGRARRFCGLGTRGVRLLAAGRARGRLGYQGAGPTAIITDLGILRPDSETGEFTLVSLHPGATVEQARDATGWDLEVSNRLEETEPPTGEELEILRGLRARTEASRQRPKS